MTAAPHAGDGSDTPTVSLPEPSANQATGRYLPHVDGLRAVAIVLVVLNHAWPKTLPGGFIGVDMFFVVSGFIITRQLLRDKSREDFSYAVFLSRRIRRLFPAAFVCMTLVSFMATGLLLPDALVDYARNLAAAAMMYANVYNLHHSSYFSAPAEFKPLLHLWSLSIEDQFYLTWPLLLAAASRAGMRVRTQLVTVLIAATASVAYAQAVVGQQPDLAFYTILPRCFPLLLGCALGLATRQGVRLPSLPAWADGLAAMTIGASAFLLDSHSAYPGFATLPLCCATLVLINSGLRRTHLSTRILGARLPVRVGRLSYSLYLWHWPLLALARYHAGGPLPAWETASLVAAAVPIAALSWRFVEQPWRAVAIRPPRQFGMAALSIVLTCGVAVAIIGGQGWPQRLDPPQRRLVEEIASRNPFRAACDGAAQAFGNDENCTFGRLTPGRPLDLAIFGDSNADHFVPMIAALAARRGLSGRQITQSTCAPLIGAARARPPNEEAACTAYQDTILQFLARNPGLKLAILSAVWSGYYGPLTANRLAASAGTQVSDFEGFVNSTVHLLRDHGIKVMILAQVPHYQSFVLRCFIQAVEHGDGSGQCGASTAAVEAELARSQAAFQALAAADPGVTVFDPERVLCGPVVCSPFLDGLFLYHDPGHLNAIGSAALARYATLPPDL